MSALCPPPPLHTIRPTQGQREEVSPRLAAKQGHGEAPLLPTLPDPRFAGQARGQRGNCRSGQPVPARPRPPGKAGLSPWGTPPADRRPAAPASPARVGTVLYSWHGKASRALPWRAHRTPSLKLSLMTAVWLSPRAREPQVPTSRSPSGRPAGALAPPCFLLGAPVRSGGSGTLASPHSHPLWGFSWHRAVRGSGLPSPGPGWP